MLGTPRRAGGEPVVPWFRVETFATVPGPVGLSFDASGALFSGRDVPDTAGGDAVKIQRTPPEGGQGADYGASALPDPDGVWVDDDGSISGTPGAVLVCGDTPDAGTARRQRFPVDAASIANFRANGLTASLVNTWAMEVDGERFVYELSRPNGRLFRVEFDLTAPLSTVPPPPWGARCGWLRRTPSRTGSGPRCSSPAASRRWRARWKNVGRNRCRLTSSST